MKRGLKILLIADSWMNLALGMIGPIYAIFVERIGGDLLDASWAYFAFMITSGVVMMMLGKWEDRTKHKEKLIVLGYFLGALGCLMYIFVNGQMTLLITQVILGLSVAVITPAFDAFYSRHTTKKEEAFDWGSVEAEWYIVTAVSAIIGGYVADIFGFRTLFTVMFVISLISVIISLRLLKGENYLNSNKSIV